LPSKLISFRQGREVQAEIGGRTFIPIHCKTAFSFMVQAGIGGRTPTPYTVKPPFPSGKRERCMQRLVVEPPSPYTVKQPFPSWCRQILVEKPLTKRLQNCLFLQARERGTGRDWWKNPYPIHCKTAFTFRQEREV
jgi:hypothetical protein